MLSGLSAFPITPADPDGRIDAAALRRLLGRLVAARVDSIGLLGSTGTYAYLSRAERLRAVETAREVAGDVPLLVGIGALRTDDAVRLARDAKAAGASVGLLAAMSYTPLAEDEVYAHVVAVATESGLPVCLYDNPTTTHFRFSADLVARLAHRDGIVAVKSPTVDAATTAAQLAELRARVPAGFSLGHSGDWNCADALCAGGDAWYSVAGGLFPEPCLAIVRAAQAGEHDEARRLDAALAPLWDVFRRFSSLRVVYAACRILGLTDREPPRPILPLDEAASREVAAVIERLGLR